MAVNGDKTAGDVTSTINAQQEFQPQTRSVCIQNSGDDNDKGSHTPEGCQVQELYGSQFSNLDRIASNYGFNSSYFGSFYIPPSLKSRLSPFPFLFDFHCPFLRNPESRVEQVLPDGLSGSAMKSAVDQRPEISLLAEVNANIELKATSSFSENNPSLPITSTPSCS